MRFVTELLVSLGLITVHAHPLTSTTAEPTGCQVDLAPTSSQPADAAENILFSIINKWENTTQAHSYFTSEWLDTRNTVQVPFFVVFLAGVIPDYESMSVLGATLDPWVGTYLVGGATPASDDYEITDVTCS